MAQSNLAYGLPFDTTLLGGLQYASQQFYAANIGLGKDMGLAGALAVDITSAHTDTTDFRHGQGQSKRLSWAKHIDWTNTDVQINFRDYSAGYYSLDDAMSSDPDLRQKKNDYSVSVSQVLARSQSVYLSVTDTAWRDNSSSSNWQMGWNTAVGAAQVSVSLSATEDNDNGESSWNKQVSLTVSLPLSALFPSRSSATLFSTMTNSLDGAGSVQAGYSDVVMNNQLNYSAQLGRNLGQSDDTSPQTNLNGTYTGRAGEIQAGYSHTSGQDKASWGATGGVVFHRHGVTAGRYSTGAMALVSAPGVKDAPLAGETAISTNPWGYTLVPDLSVYNSNTVQFDTQQSESVVSMDSLSRTLIPSRDAVVLAQFKTHPGENVVAMLMSGKENIPFGAVVNVSGDQRTFYVGDDGQVYLNGVPAAGELNVAWGDRDKCHVKYDLSSHLKQGRFNLLTLQCLK
jgi:outer membrane usher protein